MYCQRSQLADLVKRGVNPQDRRLFVIDCCKALGAMAHEVLVYPFFLVQLSTRGFHSPVLHRTLAWGA